MEGLIEQLLGEMKELEYPLEWKKITEEFPKYRKALIVAVRKDRPNEYYIYQYVNRDWREIIGGYGLITKKGIELEKERCNMIYWSYISIDMLVRNLIKLHPPKFD